MRTQAVSDAILISQFINGDEKSLGLLIDKYKNRIYSFIYSKVLDKNATEDIFQDTFIKVINTLKKGNYREEGKFLPWTMRIAHNLVIDFFRKNNKMKVFDNTDEFDIFSILKDESLNVENQFVKEQVYEDVKRIIEELPKDQKEVLIMRMYREMSFKEIAEITGVSINTALGRMRYALINMRKLIEAHNIVLH